MATFTAPVALNIRLPGGFECIGAPGVVHRIPDSLVEEFIRDVVPVIPGGVAWITQDESSYLSEGSFNVGGSNGVDDTVAVQAAIDAANALTNGGVVVFPGAEYFLNGLVLKSNVRLRGRGTFLGAGTRLRAKAGAASIITQPGSQILHASIEGFGLYGLGAGTPCIGIDLPDAYWCRLSNLFLENFADEAIKLGTGAVACQLDQILAYNCLLNRTRGAKSGVLHLEGSDHFVRASEFNSSQTTISGGTLRVCAVLVEGANHFFDSVVGEFSDVGFHVTAALSRFVNCRGDRNWGHGIEVLGNSNNFGTCLATDNGQTTTNTYDNWAVSGSGNLFTGCQSNAAGTPKHKWGFHDTQTGDTGKNQYVNCFDSGAVTAPWSTEPFAGAAVEFPIHPAMTFGALAATPSVAQRRFFKTNNASATTVTNFTGGVSGQLITIRATDANTTIADGGSIMTNTGANKLLTNARAYQFILENATWFEV